jgi:hypothetical protein
MLCGVVHVNRWPRKVSPVNPNLPRLSFTLPASFGAGSATIKAEPVIVNGARMIKLNFGTGIFTGHTLISTHEAKTFAEKLAHISHEIVTK